MLGGDWWWASVELDLAMALGGRGVNARFLSVFLERIPSKMAKRFGFMVDCLGGVPTRDEAVGIYRAEHIECEAGKWYFSCENGANFSKAYKRS